MVVSYENVMSCFYSASPSDMVTSLNACSDGFLFPIIYISLVSLAMLMMSYYRGITGAMLAGGLFGVFVGFPLFLLNGISIQVFMIPMIFLFVGIFLAPKD